MQVCDLVESEEGLDRLPPCPPLCLQQVTQLIHWPQFGQQITPVGRQQHQLPWRLGMLRHDDGWAGIRTERGGVFGIEGFRECPSPSLQRQVDLISVCKSDDVTRRSHD